MRTRAILITALLATGLTVSESRHVCAAAIGRSTQAFLQYFQALREEPLNPVERVAFSVVLAREKVKRESKAASRSMI